MSTGSTLLLRATALGAGLACVLLVATLDRLAPAGEAGRLRDARFSESVDDAGAQAVRLPHVWRDACRDCSTAWYRFDVPLRRAPRDAQAIYFPAVGHNLAVYLNGRLIGQSGRFEDPVARFDRRPVLIAAPAHLWLPGANRLYVLVKADPGMRGFLPPPALGAEEALLPVYRLRTVLRVTLPQGIAAASALLALVMILIWVNRRREPAYGWLAAAALGWAVYQFGDLAVEPPWRSLRWDEVLALPMAVSAAAFFVFARRLAWAQARRAEGWLAAAPALALFALPVDAGGVELDFVRGAVFLLFAGTGIVLMRAGWRAHGASGWLLAPGAALLLLASHDAAGIAGLWPPEQASLLPYAVALLVGAGSWALLSRFVETLNAAELLNVDLEAMVQAKTRELQAQFARIRALEHERIVAAERERLMRDMHDGIGGNLVSLLAMIEAQRSTPSELATAVRGALDDLRLMIDSLDPVDDDLNAVLAMFRDRLTPRLKAAGVELRCRFDDLPRIEHLTPARVLNLLRLLQEAVTNALKHSGARVITLEAVAPPARDGAVRIDLSDDGRGFDPAAAAVGRGLRNMARRAQEAGVDLRVASLVGGGTHVTLELSSLGSAR
jgi:signal transduction histidine kinase